MIPCTVHLLIECFSPCRIEKTLNSYDYLSLSLHSTWYNKVFTSKTIEAFSGLRAKKRLRCAAPVSISAEPALSSKHGYVKLSL